MTTRSNVRHWPCALTLLLLVIGCGRSRLDELLADAHSDDTEQQRLALRKIADLGAEAAPAVPSLIELTRHQNADVRRLSGLALGNITAVLPDADVAPAAEVIDALETQLTDTNRGVQNTAAFALLHLEPDHAAAQQQLTAAMRKGDGGIIDRLKRLHPSPDWAVPALIEILRGDPRPGIRRLAAVALGLMDSEDPDVQNALRGALRDTDDRVREAAKESLPPAVESP